VEARPQDFFGAPAFALTPEWEFLYLCIHATDHEWQSLKWLADINQLASSGQVDWKKTMTKADRFELDLVVRQTLAALSLLFETQLPPGWTPAALPAGVELFSHAPFPAGAAESAFAFRHLRVLSRPLDKLRYLADVVFVPKLTDRDFVRLPPALGFLYYVIRPPRLVLKWAACLLRRCSWTLCSAGLWPAVRKASCPPLRGRDALATAAGTAAPRPARSYASVQPEILRKLRMTSLSFLPTSLAPSCPGKAFAGYSPDSLWARRTPATAPGERVQLAGLLQQFENASSDWIQAVVHAGLKIQQNHLLADFAGENFLRNSEMIVQC
jgi:hypothetical protein